MNKKIPLKSIVLVICAVISWVYTQARDDKGNRSESHGPSTTASSTADSVATAPAPQPSDTQAVEASHTSKLKYLKGKKVTVTGKVSNTAKSASGHHFLNFHGSSFKVMCPSEYVSKFKGGGPAALYEGKQVAITGVIDLYKGAPQIKLMDPAAIREVKPGESSVRASNPDLGKLKEVKRGVWESAAGMVYRGRDSEGKTRMEHVLRHTRNIPDRAGTHGVFTVENEQDVFALIDEAWLLGREKGIRAKVEGHSATYTIPMGRKIGYAGGRSGGSRGNPALYNMFIVVRTGTQEVITAYPR